MWLTQKQAEVLSILLRSDAEELHGLAIVKGSGGRVSRGTVYHVLEKLEEKGLVRSRREDPGAHPGNPRRLYRPVGNAALVLDHFEALIQLGAEA